MRRSTVRYGRSRQVDHDMGTGSPVLGYSRSSIAQLNRSHPYSSRWVAVAFYLEQVKPPAKSASYCEAELRHAHPLRSWTGRPSFPVSGAC